MSPRLYLQVLSFRAPNCEEGIRHLLQLGSDVGWGGDAGDGHGGGGGGMRRGNEAGSGGNGVGKDTVSGGGFGSTPAVNHFFKL